ncbi:hypothetical protein ABEF95_001087 [Exophiala dermatitidis]
MRHQIPHPQTLFHLIPDAHSLMAKQMLYHPDNEPFLSVCKSAPITVENGYGLEVGYHVSRRPRPLVIGEVGRNADLVMPGSSISKVHFSFEVHPESRHIMFVDRSRLHGTRISPEGFRLDGDFRQVVLMPGKQYTIFAGAENSDQFVFHLHPIEAMEYLLPKVELDSQMLEARGENPRWARTTEGAPTVLSAWYSKRLREPAVGVVQRAVEGGRLGKDQFGEVLKAVDCDSGCLIVVKKIKLDPRKESAVPYKKLWSLVQREVAVLSEISHKNIVEYLGTTGWDTDTIRNYMGLNEGSLYDLLAITPSLSTNAAILTRLYHDMLQVLDYLASRHLLHRDVKPENILYTSLGDGTYLFQLADFGLANQCA